MPAAWLAACCAASGEELSIKPREGVLLLTNGELLSGTIISAGDRYDVHLPNGEIRVRRSDVAMVCADAVECYRHKRSGIELGRVQDHLDLAEWCVKNQLLAEAETELKAAATADPRHPKIPLVESRLALARRPIEPATSQASKAVSQASLESTARTLPSGAMENYTTTIQPLLLNYCAKGGCHAGRGDNTLALERLTPKLSGAAPPSAICNGCWRWSTARTRPRARCCKRRFECMAPRRARSLPIAIRRNTASSSYGSTRSPGRCSTAKAPTLEERTAPLLQTVSRGTQPTDDPTEKAETTRAQAPSDQRTIPAPQAANIPPANAPRDGRDIPASSADQAYTREQLRSMGLLRQALSEPSSARVELPATFTPKDPFDPEIFNRRFFGK